MSWKEDRITLENAMTDLGYKLVAQNKTVEEVNLGNLTYSIDLTGVGANKSLTNNKYIFSHKVKIRTGYANVDKVVLKKNEILFITVWKTISAIAGFGNYLSDPVFTVDSTTAVGEMEFNFGIDNN